MNEHPGDDDAPLPLRISGMVKRFGRTLALDHASLHVRVGERVSLLGPNGAGKTTLTRCIAGRAVPDDGEIEILGRRLHAGEQRPALGLVPQHVAVYPDLTARENLAVFGRFHRLGGKRLRQAIEWALEWTELGARADDLVHVYSGGMQRRLNIACGVLHDPSLVLLDEPTAGVDPQSRERIFAMLDELQRRGASLLLTTHHLAEAETWSDRIVIIDGGRIIADGALSDLIERTTGRHRRVTFTLAAPPLPLNGFRADDTGRTLAAEVEDVGQELPRLLQQIDEAGGQIVDIGIDAPSLHAVFMQLTSRELRE